MRSINGCGYVAVTPRSSTIAQAQSGHKLVSVIRYSGESATEGVGMSMEIRSGHSELSVISQVSAVEGCPLSGIPLYSI